MTVFGVTMDRRFVGLNSRLEVPTSYYRMMQLTMVLFVLINTAYSWSSTPTSMQARSRGARSGLSATATFDVMDGTKGVDDSILNQAALFMLHSFWNIEESDVSESSPLFSPQKADLEVLFAERLGKRRLNSALVLARSSDGSLSGMIGVEVSLWDREEKKILSYIQSEDMLNNAIASLGPKQRREYKDASLRDLVEQLPALGGKFEVVAVLANLAVSPKFRGSGLGKELCRQIESILIDRWDPIAGPNQIFLNVERENKAAVGLYTKLGYEEMNIDKTSTTLRVDLATSSFVDHPCEMITLRKIMQS